MTLYHCMAWHGGRPTPDSHGTLRSSPIAQFPAAMESLAHNLAPCAAAVAAGYLLRRTGAFTALDGQTATKYMTWLTLPSLILQSFSRAPPQPLLLPVVGTAALLGAVTAGITWVATSEQHPKEQGLLTGSALGGGLMLTAYPLAQAVFGEQGLRLALLWGAVNSVAVWVGSFLLVSTAGAAFPEEYKHVDGGSYRGEWKGMLKEGFGVYTYPSGARYEGEWVDNLKEGRGVYHFPRGGVYEGEWRRGKMEGVGVRTFASGKVQAGVWRDGKLESPQEERQCALAVEGANEAAAVARRVQVGGGSLQRAAGLLLTDPCTWAYAAAVALAVLQRQLTPTLDMLTSQLATAHAPLALLALGLTLDLKPPHARQVRDVSAILALRLLPPLLLAAAAAAVLGGPLGWSAARTVSLVAPLLMCGLAPVAPQVQDFAYRFRLNENLADALIRTTTAASLLLLPLTAAAAALSTWAGSLRPFLTLLGAAAATAFTAAAAASRVRPGKGQQQGQQGQQPGRMQGKVRMVYAGPKEEGAAAGGAAGASSAGQPAAPVTAAAGEAGSGATQVDSSADAPTESSGEGAGSSGATSAAAAEQEVLPPQQQRRAASAFQDVEPAAPAAPAEPPASSSSDGEAGGQAGRPQAAGGMPRGTLLPARQRLRPFGRQPEVRQAVVRRRALPLRPAATAARQALLR